MINACDVWLFTGASATPVTELVGKTFMVNHHRERSHRNVCVGIFPWGCVEGRDQLLGEMVRINLNLVCFFI